MDFYKDSNGEEIVAPSMQALLGEKLVPQQSNDPWSQRQEGSVITATEPMEYLSQIHSYQDVENHYFQNKTKQLYACQRAKEDLTR